MTEITLSTDIIHDLKLIFSNPRKIFPQRQGLTFGINYVLLNTIWKEYGFKYENRERVGLSYAIGNFFMSYFNSGFENDPYKVLIDGWSDLYEYYILNKQRGRKFALKEIEPHFILSLISTAVIIEERKFDNIDPKQDFFEAMDPFLSTFENLDIELSKYIAPHSFYDKFEDLFTWEQYISQLRHSIYDLDDISRMYYLYVIDHEKEIYTEHKKLYQNTLWIFNNHIDYWRKGEFLFKISEDGTIIKPTYKYTF